MKLSIMAISALLAAIPAVAQRGEKSLACEQQTRQNGKQVSFCEMREQNVGYGGLLNIDGGSNGGINVKGWDNPGVLVRSRVEGWAGDQASAQSMVSQVNIVASAGQVRATGPSQQGNTGWSVSYEVFVPRNADLSLSAHNGGIGISDVHGNIKFSTTNGGVSLKRLAGDVEGTTTNGGVNVELAGNRWDGTKLDARTSNGGVNITMPENYSAHFETQTVNGHLNANFPMTVRGDLSEVSKKIALDIGSGGPTIHVETTNGGVNVKKATM